MSDEKKKPLRITFRMNVSKIDKEHLTFVKNKDGEVEAIGDFILNYYEDDIKMETKAGKEYSHNGYVSQNVNAETYKAEKDKPYNQRTSLGILGNAKVWKTAGATEEGIPGAELKPVSDTEAKKVTSSLPF